MPESSYSSSHPPACRHCRDTMYIEEVSKHPGNAPWIIGGMGIFLSLFLGGLIVGIPMICYAIYMRQTKETICLCHSCGYFFPVYSNRDRNKTNS